MEYLTSLPGLAALTVFVTTFVVAKIPSGTDFFGLVAAKQLVSWIVAVLLVFGVSHFDLSAFMEGDGLAGILLNGLGVGLLANGIKDVAVVTKIINGVKEKLPQKDK